MLGLDMRDNETEADYYARMDSLIAALPKERQQALLHAIRMILRTFMEGETRGVLILIDAANSLTTMGLNATYAESSEMVYVTNQMFVEAALSVDTGVKH